MSQLRQHDVTLASGIIVLRPTTEDDWVPLHKWWNDPEVAQYADAGGNPDGYTLEQLQDIHRTISAKAFCFIIEYGGRPIGECWLQEMNLERILKRRPVQDCRRIDIAIGEKEYWGHGIGTEAIRLLVDFGFRQEQADIIFGLDIVDHNPRSLKAFQKAGFELYETVEEYPQAEPRCSYDVVLVREGYSATMAQSK